MSEVQFAKTFLATLDRKPIKLSSDFVSDARNYPSQCPYILPKPTHPFPARDHASSPSSGATPTLTITLRPTKPPHPTLELQAQDPTQTTMLDLKEAYAAHASLDISKIKILHNKRPASDLKTLKELLPTGAGAQVELSVMVLGGGGSGAATLGAAPMEGVERAATPAVSVPELPIPADASSKTGLGEVEAELQDEKFWGDLRDFLVQRLKDEREGERLVGVFRGAVR